MIALRILTVGLLLSGAAHAEGFDPTVTVTYPGKDWVFRFDLVGGVETYNNHRAGVSSYFTGMSVTRGFNVSVELVPAKSSATAEECRDLLLAPLKGRPEVPEFAMTKPGAHPRLEALNAQFKGTTINQKHIHEVYLQGDVCAKLHVSKVQYTPQDDAAFEALFRTARFEPVGADGSVKRSFIFGRGEFASLTMPVRWGFEREAPRKNMPLGLFLLEPTQDFKMGLRVVNAEAVIRPESDGDVRGFVRRAKDQMLASAVEKEADLVELLGVGGKGYFYQVTNSTPVEQQKKGRDWHYLYQGALPQGGYVAIFTIYTNQRDSADVKSGLELARNMTLMAQQGTK